MSRDRFSTPRGFGPIVTVREREKGRRSDGVLSFQYPEGFWPDSDPPFKKKLPSESKKLAMMFQYPEGFWPDSDWDIRSGID